MWCAPAKSAVVGSASLWLAVWLLVIAGCEPPQQPVKPGRAPQQQAKPQPQAQAQPGPQPKPRLTPVPPPRPVVPPLVDTWPPRAVWVPRDVYKSPQQIAALMEAAKQAMVAVRTRTPFDPSAAAGYDACYRRYADLYRHIKGLFE